MFDRFSRTEVGTRLRGASPLAPPKAPADIPRNPLPPPPAPKEYVADIGIPLAALKAGQCRWPIAMFDDEHRFCAEPTNGNGPYCARHHALACPPRPVRIKRRPSRAESARLLKAILGIGSVRTLNLWQRQGLLLPDAKPHSRKTLYSIENLYRFAERHKQAKGK
jgi:hypothetical protein